MGTGFGGGMAGGWGQTGAVAQQPQARHLRDFKLDSSKIRDLLNIDEAYNALNTKCAFRTIVYNRCHPGEADDKVTALRFHEQQCGGDGGTDDYYLRGMRENPDRERFYPFLLHFMQDLKKRCEQQEKATKSLNEQTDHLLSTMDILARTNQTQEARIRGLQKNQLLLYRRWLTILQKVETLRKSGMPINEEVSISLRAKQITQMLTSPGIYLSQLEELEPYMREDATRIDQYTTDILAKRPLLVSEMDPTVTREVGNCIVQVQADMERLDDVLTRECEKITALYKATLSNS
ncbi:nucleoporin (NUP54/57) [Angomonas deanei]|nr:nucleoporin (NUP54/57) [Angomonas deanei]|eukprot:EPY21406.1 nucleoporin (NUP54/57) [Angomonas deanei]